jgi:dephospho-CoA kinase
MATPRPARRPRRVVAVTGGLAAGKSEALKAFEHGGAAVCSSDEIVHRLIAEDPEVRQALEQRLGTTDRARIAEAVFCDPDELAWLESVLHPRVRGEYLAWLERLGDGVDVAVVEIPLLYETGGEELFDAVVVVTAPEETRRARAGERVAERSGRFIPDDEKVRRADYAYVNVGSLADLEAFVARVLAELGA